MGAIKAQRIQQPSNVIKHRYWNAWLTDAHRGTGHPIQHPRRHDTETPVWELADRDGLPLAILPIRDGYSGTERRVPGVVNLTRFAEMSRMNGALSWEGRTTTDRGRSEAPRSRRSSTSLLETAKLCGVDPKHYLTEATHRAIDDPGAVLLPHDLR